VRTLPIVLLVTVLPVSVSAQTIDDGVMLKKGTIYTTGTYTRETWDEYWEGERKRENGNVGTIETKINTWSANYAVTDRLNVIGVVPYVWTSASQGVLHGIDGFQDVTLAAKYSVVDRQTANESVVRALAVVAAGIPTHNYNPELPPLSIGSGSTRLSGRGTLMFHARPGWFVNGSGAYTWRSHVTLDRPYFFTNDEFVMSDEVDMPNVADYGLMGGYMHGNLMAAITFMQQHTLGGGDIRRQDMPFVSNRMNFSKLGVMGMYPIPGIDELGVEFAYSHTIRGRNVGQADTWTIGMVYYLGSGRR
jgi:hypothetical protein